MGLVVAYDAEAARRLMRQTPNLFRWYDRAHAVRTHEHCSLGLEHIERTIAVALERAYTDGVRDGATAERETALLGMHALVEGLVGSMQARLTQLQLELAEFRRTESRVFPASVR